MSTTTVVAAKVYSPSYAFLLDDSAGNSITNILLNGGGGAGTALFAATQSWAIFYLDSGSFLRVSGSHWYASVDSLTGHDQLVVGKDRLECNQLFCTLQDFVNTRGSLTCSVGGPEGQENIFQICNGNYYLSTSVVSSCQQVTLTAYSAGFKDQD